MYKHGFRSAVRRDSSTIRCARMLVQKILLQTLLLSWASIILRNPIFRNSIISIRVVRRVVPIDTVDLVAQKISRTEVEKKGFLLWVVISACFQLHFQQTHELLFIRYRETVTVAAAVRAFPYPHLSISVLSVFALLPRETEKKRRVRGKTGETEGKEILFVLEATPISIVAAHRRAAAVAREYINFASSRNCTPVLPSSPTFSFLLQYLVPSVTKMNKVYFVSSQTVTSVFQHELIKMTRLVRPCQVFLALTGTPFSRGRKQSGKRKMSSCA